jgi:hypothetical protein
MARTAGAGAPFWDLYTKHFKSPAFVDVLATAALDGAAPYTSPLARREVAMKAVEAGLMVSAWRGRLTGCDMRPLFPAHAALQGQHLLAVIQATRPQFKTGQVPWQPASPVACAKTPLTPKQQTAYIMHEMDEAGYKIRWGVEALKTPSRNPPCQKLSRRLKPPALPLKIPP